MRAVSDEKMRLSVKVLTCWTDGEAPSSEDIQLLQPTSQNWFYLPPDELACAVIRERQRN